MTPIKRQNKESIAQDQDPNEPNKKDNDAKKAGAGCEHPKERREEHQKRQPKGSSTDDMTKKAVEKEMAIAELTSDLQRLQAEFENYRKRIQKECSDIIRSSNKELLKKLLPVLDNICLAQKNKDNPKEYIKGTELIFDQLKEIIYQEGVKEIESEGHDFDPNLHEALMMVDCPKEQEGKVIEEFQRGYRMDNKILRHARVKVGKASQASCGEQDKEAKNPKDCKDHNSKDPSQDQEER